MALSAMERRWAQATFEAYAPPGAGGLAPRASETDFLAVMDTMMSAGTPQARLGVRLALWLLALAPLWTLTRFRLLASLPVAERTTLVQKLVYHPLFLVRGLAMLFKINVAFALLSVPSVRARSGYDPDAPRPAPKPKSLPLATEREATP